MSCRPCVVVGLALLGLASGCAYGEVRQVVRAQFASELDCPEVQIKRRDAWYGYDTPNQFKVYGCGVVRTYTCDDPDGRVSYDEPACTWVNGDADAPQMAKPTPEAGDEPLDEPMDEPPLEDSSGSGSEDSLEDDSSGDAAEESEDDSETESAPAPKAPVKKGGAKVGGSLKLGR